MRHLYIPDCQVKPRHSTEYLRTIGNYIVSKQPDVIVCGGDFADMESLSSYDKGRKCFEGRRYKQDVEAVHRGMEHLLSPLREYNAKQNRNKKQQYKPRMVLTLGNHCNRIDRAIDNDAMLDGTIGIQDLRYKEYGWEVYPFLQVVLIDGVAYSHYFTTGVAGRPASTASALLSKKHQSCIAGHQQGRQIASAIKADGNPITAIIAGSCYEHDEDYMGPQGNKHWRGVVMLNEVHEGSFDECFVSLDFLKKRYDY